MGATIDLQNQMDVNGRPAQVISATICDQMSGRVMRSTNVFIQGANIGSQVMGGEQSAKQIQQILQAILGSLQF